MRRKRSIVWKIVWVLVLAPVLLVAFVQTPPGKALLASTVSGVLGRSENLEIRIGKISGWIPGDVDIDVVEIGDAQGIWVTARELHCRWMLRAMLDKRIHLAALGAEEIVLHRFPRYGKKEGVARGERSGFQPLEIRLDGLKVKRLRLDKGVAGIPLEYAVHSGGIAYLASGRLSGELAVGGDAEGQVELDALLTGTADDHLKITARLERMLNPTFGLDRLSGRGEATISGKGVSARLAADLVEGGGQGTVSTRLHYAARNLRLQQFQFTSKDFSAQGDLTLDFSPGLIDVALDSTYMDANTNRYDVRGVVAVATSNQTWGVDVQSLEIRSWDAVAFTLSGMLDPEKVELSGELAEFDVGALPMFGMSNFTGTVNGRLSVSGSLENPQVVAGMDVVRFSSANEALDELPDLDFSIAGGVVDGELFGSTLLTNYSSGFFSADFSMPCRLSFAPFSYKPEPAGFAGALEADLDFDIFNQLAVFENQRIEGALKAKLGYGNQEPSGFLEFENGLYEHYDWGILFRDCNAELAATPGGFEFKQARATDGGTGEVALSGRIGRGELDMQVSLSGAKILQRPELDARISGQLNLSGKTVRPDVTGTLVIDRADILLDNVVSTTPPLLTDFDLHAKTNQAVAAKIRDPLPFGVDIAVEMPDQIYVNASLIDSVWGGALQMRDVPDGISIKGKVEPRRGYVSFIGKKFRFQQGEVVFDGSVPPLAVLNNLTAEYSRSDITAQLVLNGNINDPQFQLKSTPAMPEDEILSHVLFNRDSTTISPYQAYQIAAAAQQLSGGVNGPGFMYGIRQAVGIDTLEWREADAAGGASSVAAGKYITPGLYVEVNSSFDAEAETGMMAEYEVTRHFSVETSTGPKMRPGIGVNWKNDY